MPLTKLGPGTLGCGLTSRNGTISLVPTPISFVIVRYLLGIQVSLGIELKLEVGSRRKVGLKAVGLGTDDAAGRREDGAFRR